MEKRSFASGRLTAQLLNVMYDPLAYAAPSARSAVPRTGPIAWQNRKLIEHHGLACRIDFAPEVEHAWWIEHWPSLRRMAFLIGCRCLRDTLVAERHLLHLDPAARRFTMLPVVAPSTSAGFLPGQPIDDLILHAQGFRLIDTLSARLPTALRQRLALLFHDVGRASHEGAAHEASALYPMLISTASRHAQAYPY
jgi:type III secretion system OrgA/MxiK family protein